MSAQATVQCDKCFRSAGNYNWRTVAACRRDLRAQGWITGRVDVCPLCQEGNSL